MLAGMAWHGSRRLAAKRLASRQWLALTILQNLCNIISAVRMMNPHNVRANRKGRGGQRGGGGVRTAEQKNKLGPLRENTTVNH
jgi:hypothetical protein